MRSGTILCVMLNKGFGFLRPDGEQRDVYFHRSVCELEFDSQLIQRPILFEDCGRNASRVIGI